jgi:hypothetical protein
LNPPENTITFKGFVAAEAPDPVGTCDIVARPLRKREFLCRLTRRCIFRLSIDDLESKHGGHNAGAPGRALLSREPGTPKLGKGGQDFAVSARCALRRAHAVRHRTARVGAKPTPIEIGCCRFRHVLDCRSRAGCLCRPRVAEGRPRSG